MIWDFLFNSIWGWLGLGGLIIAGLIVAGVFFPGLRHYLWGAAAVVGGAVGLYSKGHRDALKREKEIRDAMVKEKQRQYAEIERRPDTDDDVDKRLRDGNF